MSLLEDKRQARISQQEAIQQRIEVNPNPLTAGGTAAEMHQPRTLPKDALPRLWAWALRLRWYV